jgi:NAD(P) transhydrogenase subunit alpha
MNELIADAASAVPFVYVFTVFVLAIFVGYYVVWGVTPALHTPLMAVTNALSGIIIVGAMLQAVTIEGDSLTPTSVLGAVAVFLASINIFGGFAVTNRMLEMFRKKKKQGAE